MKISCEEAKQLLPLFVDNMTDKQESDAVCEHLNECAECRREYDFYKSIIGVTASMPSVEPSPDFNERLHKKLLEAKNAKRHHVLSSFRRASFTVLASAAVIALSVVSLNVLKDRDISDQPPIHNTQLEATSAPVHADEAIISGNTTRAAEEILQSGALTSDDAEESGQDSLPNAEKNNVLEPAVAVENGVLAENMETKAEIKDNIPQSEAAVSEEATEKNHDFSAKEQAAKDKQSVDNGVMTASLPTSDREAAMGGGSGASSGGGSSGAAVFKSGRAAVKVKLTNYVTVDSASLAEAQKILSDYPLSGGAYKLTTEEYHDVLAQLEALNASVVTETENKTEAYEELNARLSSLSGAAAEQTQKELDMLDDETSSVYVVLIER